MNWRIATLAVLLGGGLACSESQSAEAFCGGVMDYVEAGQGLTAEDYQGGGSPEVSRAIETQEAARDAMFENVPEELEDDLRMAFVSGALFPGRTGVSERELAAAEKIIEYCASEM